MLQENLTPKAARLPDKSISAARVPTTEVEVARSGTNSARISGRNGSNSGSTESSKSAQQNSTIISTKSQTGRGVQGEQDLVKSAEVAGKGATSCADFATNSDSIFKRKPINNSQEKREQYHISTQEEDDCVSEWETSEFEEE